MDQNTIIQANILSQQSEQLKERLGLIKENTAELDNFKKSLEMMSEEKNYRILSPVGRGVFVKSDVQENSFFVDVGAGIFVKKTNKETRDLVSDQLEKLNSLENETKREIMDINEKLQLIVSAIESKN